MIEVPSKYISKLDLSGQKLQKFPVEILNLNNLRKLNLSNNQISEIPKEISKLKMLENLDISNNNLNSLKANFFGLTRLKVLNLNNNQITKLPKQVEYLTKLRKLFIANNRIESLPPQLSNCSLIELNISKNPIHEFPEVLLNLKYLKKLWLGNLHLKNFPYEQILNEMDNLESIYCFSYLKSNSNLDSEYQYLSKYKGNVYHHLILMKNKKTKSVKSITPMQKQSINKNKIFISYSHEDKKWLKEVQKHLKTLSFDRNDFEVWDDTKIKSGDNWKEEVETALSASSIAILIISTNFLASDFIQNNELPPLLKSAQEKGTRILPLIVGYSRFLKNENLSQFQAVNDPNEPLIACTSAMQQKILVKLTDDIEENL
ncbi:MAG: leucine-rich repeat domain-containing protein [Candidatus Woesearchaeota archaeon]